MLKRKWLTIATLGAVLSAAGAAAAGKTEFVDYYASASSLIDVLNGIASDVDNMDLRRGNFSDEQARDLKLRVAKAREGFAALLTYDAHTSDLNEGYILYLDKVLLALILAGENKARTTAENENRIDAALTEAAALRTQLNATIQKDRKKWGVE